VDTNFSYPLLDMKKKKTTKRNFYILLGTFLLCFVLFFAKHLLRVGTAYNAKNLCSCVFVAERDADFVNESELGPYWYISTTVDKAEKSVTATFLGMLKAKAYYREGLGCSLLNGKSISDLNSQADGFTRSKIDSLQPFNLFISDSVQEVKLNKGKLEKALVAEFQKTDKKQTRAVVVLYDSLLVTEKYADGFGKDMPLMGWSMTKSITATLVAMLIKEGKLSLQQKALFEEWQNSTDPRKDITLDHLLRMSSGLKLDEEYFLPSDATKMLFSSQSVAQIPKGKQLEFPIDTHWSYSSGTSNVVSQLVRNQFENQQAYWSYPYDSLFNKLGMESMIMEPDASGTFVGSSFAYATARDWAKLGALYLKKGYWNGEQIFNRDWASYVGTPTPTAEGGVYGAHFWMDAGDSKQEKLWKGIPKDAYYMSGFEKQCVMIIPSRNIVIVRLSYSKTNREDLGNFVESVLNAFEKVEVPVFVEEEETE
jgi:CubicO group peptidase (beta-lactamase class C family)